MSLEALRAATVHLGERSYPVLVGGGLLGRLGEAMDEQLPDVTGCVVVTSPSVDGLYGGQAMKALEALHPGKVIVPEGEEAKTWDAARGLLGALIGYGLDRRGVVVALGGGSVGDSAGFAASIHMRGVRVVQVPTTLLGQVDSGVGGKTAVNHPAGKNLIGSFHQPGLVACDTGLLATLPRRELCSGLAEVAKYGVITDSILFKGLKVEAERLLAADAGALRWVVARCVVAKARYVEADERDEKGIRAALNYGHTLGHAVETLSDHSIRHGEAVSIGMVAASRVAVSLGLLRQADLERQITLLGALGLPTEAPYGVDDVLHLMRRDKKAEHGSIRLVLPTGIGSEPVVRGVSDAEIWRALGA
jgi:3-dehydroquinate synthase